MEHENRRRTLSFTIRYQPNSNNPLVSVVDWLKSLNKMDRRDKIEKLCLMTLLPYALKANGKTNEEIESCYWDVHERLQHHLFVMRQTLGIRLSANIYEYDPKDTDADSKNVNSRDSIDSIDSIAEKELKEVSLSDIDSIFGV